MRHRNFGKILGRNHHQRQALLLGLTRSVFTYGFVETTDAKAKAVKGLVENLCASAVRNNLDARRNLYCYLQNHHWVNDVVAKMTATFPGQQSNFVKITNIKRRQGDDTLIVKLSLVKPISFLKKPVKTTPPQKEPPKATKPKVIKKPTK